MPGFPMFWYREDGGDGVNHVYRKGDDPADAKKPQFGPRYLIKHTAPNRRERHYIAGQLARGVAPSQIRVPLGL